MNSLLQFLLFSFLPLSMIIIFIIDVIKDMIDEAKSKENKKVNDLVRIYNLYKLSADMENIEILSEDELEELNNHLVIRPIHNPYNRNLNRELDIYEKVHGNLSSRFDLSINRNFYDPESGECTNRVKVIN